MVVQSTIVIDTNTEKCYAEKKKINIECREKAERIALYGS